MLPILINFDFILQKGQEIVIIYLFARQLAPIMPAMQPIAITIFKRLKEKHQKLVVLFMVLFVGFRQVEQFYDYV